MINLRNLNLNLNYEFKIKINIFKILYNMFRISKSFIIKNINIRIKKIKFRKINKLIII